MKKNLWRTVLASCLSFLMIGTFIPYAVKAEDPVTENTASDQYAEGEAIVLYKKNNFRFYMASPDEKTLSSSNQFKIADEMDFNVSDTDTDNSKRLLQSSMSATTEKVAVIKSSTLSTEDLVDKLKTMDDVEYAEPNYYYQLMSISTNPDDTLYQAGLQWGLGSTADGGVDYAAALTKDANTANKKDNIVAVVDTGVDYTNPDLQNMMWTNPGNIGLAGTYGYDFGNMDADPMPNKNSQNDMDNHGTHCAGLVAAQTNNQIGAAGVAQHTKIMAMKVCDDNTGHLSSSAVYHAYEYIIQAKTADQNIVAINDSWGGASYSSVLDYVVNQAGKAGIISLLSAGNSGSDLNDKSTSHDDDYLKSPYAVIVGASNYSGELTSFSTYNATAVDLSAPGANMLSTVSVSDEEHPENYVYNPTLSSLTNKKQLQTKELADLAGTNGTINEIDPNTSNGPGYAVYYVEDLDKNQTHIKTANNGLYTFSKIQINNRYYLQVTADITKLPANKTLQQYPVVLFWGSINPFFNQDVTASEYEYGISTFPYAAGNTAINSAAFYARGINMNDAVNAALGINCGSIYSMSDYEQNNKYILKSTDINADQENIGNAVNIVMLSDNTAKSNSVILYLSEAGISKTSEEAAYGFMSGTSMSTPFLTGCLAELASLYPNETPLQLRGRLVGSTVSLKAANDANGNKKQTASDGRFTFDKALDDLGSAVGTTINANTWELTNVENRITIHGYALSDAVLYVDDTSHKEVTKTTYNPADDTLTFTAPASLFDGKQHRFDVYDKSSNMYYQASYVVPELAGTATQLTKVGLLPIQTAGASTGVLISATDRLFFADSYGSYLYSCTDLAKASDVSAWKKLSQIDQSGDSALINQTTFTYVYADGKLYGFYTDGVSDENKSQVKYAVYDILTDTWAPSVTLASFDTSKEENGNTWTISYSRLNLSQQGNIVMIIQPFETATVDGVAVQHNDNLLLYIKHTGSDVFEKSEIPCDKLVPDKDIVSKYEGTLFYYQNGDKQYLVGDEEKTNKLFTLVYDGSTWTNQGYVSGVPDVLNVTLSDVYALPGVNTKNGNFLTGSNFIGVMGDTYFIDPAANTWQNLGTIVGTTTVITSAEMFRNQMYLSGTSGKNGEIYTVPSAVQEILGDLDITVRAVSTEGGSASVKDWRSQSGPDLSIRSGDTAIWTAKAEDDYKFLGWEDENGNIVSTDLVYQQTGVLSGRTLKAVFSGEAKNETENPDTGDHTNLQLWIFLMIISGGAASVSFALKHRYN